MPARQFWSTTVYDMEAAGLARDSPRIELNSYQDPKRGPDGSVDVFFGPRGPPARRRTRSPPRPARPWFTAFRFYGPEPPLFEKTWRLPDIERVGERPADLKTWKRPDTEELT